MRALDCDCGQHLEADNDEGLFDRAREHINRDHPNLQLTDEQIRQLLAERAYDKTDAPSSQPSDTLAGIDIPPRASAVMGGGGCNPAARGQSPTKTRRTPHRRGNKKRRAS